MIRRLLNQVIQRVGRGQSCRNTQLLIDAEHVPGHQAQVVVRMVDKCTGASFVATYEPETVERIINELRARSAWVMTQRRVPPPAPSVERDDVVGPR
jgi:hypothetical protein